MKNYIHFFRYFYEKKCINKIKTTHEVLVLKEVVELLKKKFPDCNYFLHGGAIRDILINETPCDYDVLVVNEDADDELIYEINQYLGKYTNSKMFFVDARFFSCKLINLFYKGITIDIVCSKSLSGHIYGANLTVNSIHYELVTDKIYDYQKGIVDILLKKLRLTEYEEKMWKKEVSIATFLKIVNLWVKNDFRLDKKNAFLLMKNKSKIIKMVKKMSLMNPDQEKDFLKQKNIRIIKDRFPLSSYINFFNKISV